MKKHQPCKFGMDVKSKLLEMNQTQTWLIEEVKGITGLYVDSSLMYKIITGERAPTKIIQAIREILQLPNDQQKGA